MAQRESKVFVEKIAQKFAHPIVGPSSVHQQQSFQELELSYRIITSKHGLHTFLTGNTNPNVSGCKNIDYVKQH